MRWIDWLKAIAGFGEVVGEERAATRRDVGDPRVIQPLPLSLQLQRIGGGLTPIQVSEILRLADTGYVYRLVDLANESRQKDAHLQSVLQTREIALQGLPWQVRPLKTAGRKKDKKQAEFVEDALRACVAPPGLPTTLVGFEGLIAHLAGGDYHGHAVSETIFDKVDGKIVPRAFSALGQRRFVFDLADGSLKQWDATGGTGVTYPGVDLQKAYPGKFIQFLPRIVGDVQCREGLVRPLMWAALFRNWDLRDWLTLAELAWKPWRTGTYAEGATDADIANLRNALEQMTATGVAVFRDTATANVHWPANGGRGTSAHKELFDAMGAEMSKAVLGQTETTQASTSSGYAQAKVHNEIRKDIRDARARALAEVIRRDLIAPLVWMNFGPDAPVPTFEFLTEDSVDLVAFSQMLVNVRNPVVGMRIPAAWARGRLGIPEPESDDEEVLGDTDEEDDETSDDAAAAGKKPEVDDPSEEDADGTEEEDAGAGEA